MRLLLFLAVLISPVRAENPLKIGLVAEVREIAAGEKFYVGLHLEHPPGTHTYWKHPGIVGLATSVKWDLPEGFQVGEIEWPAPQVVKMAKYDAQGYEGETLLMVPITPPKTIGETEVTIRGKISWMCCGKTCEPAVDVPVGVVLPVGKAVRNEATADWFEKSRRSVPKAAEDWREVSATRDGEGITLSIKLGEGFPATTRVRFFTADGQVDSDQRQETQISPNGNAVMKLCISDSGPKDATGLPGVVEISAGGVVEAVEVFQQYGK